MTLLIWMPLATCLASPAARALERPAPARITPLFAFHSNFWVNLHQVLFHEAKLRAGKPDRLLQSARPLSAAGMSRKGETDWNAAVGFYAAYFATRQQHGDDELVEINDDLAAQPDDGEHLNPTGLPPALVTALQSAATVYRKYWWPAHNASNENWIASQKGRLQNLGPGLASAMTKDLHQTWPATPIHVDVCHYVVALGYANTTLRPAHITFSSSDPSNQGVSGFELLFHEASHTFADTVMNALAAEGRAQHKDVGDLWHSLLFYTSGVELRRVLPAPQRAGFTPYAYRYGVYRGRWRQYRRVLEADWQPYLEGRMGFTRAIHSMVAGLR